MFIDQAKHQNCRNLTLEITAKLNSPRIHSLCTILWSIISVVLLVLGIHFLEQTGNLGK